MVQRRYLTLLIVLAIFFNSAYGASLFNTDFGGVSVTEVTIPAQGYTICGTLYAPKNIIGKVPALALAHGVSNTKEVLSGIALELARNGYVALTIDEKGHGESSTGFGVIDPTLGLGSAVTYLTTLPYVNASLIGVCGHSMGAGAVRVTISSNPTIAAAVLIGGGQGDSSTYIPMDTTHPRNLLFIVGRNDILFDLQSLDTYLRPVFGTSDKIVPEKVYGEFGDGTARELIILGAIHLVEPVDRVTVEGIVNWVNSALRPEASYPLLVKTQIYLIREALITVTFLAFVALIIPISQVINELLPGVIGEPVSVRYRFLRERRVLILWSLLGLIIFLPAMLLGVIIQFPPLLFGSSMAWWLLTTGVIGLATLLIQEWRSSKGGISVFGYLRESFRVRDIIVGVMIFCVLYGLSYSSAMFLGEKIRFLFPIFTPLTPVRAQIFPLFIPFYLVYFTAEGLYLHVYRERQTAGSASGNMARTMVLKLLPYLVLLAAQYLPMFVANYRLIPGTMGFFIEFIWGIVPLLIISTFSSWWLYRHTGRIWTGIVLNTILFAWASAGLFPFTAFT